MHTSIHADDFGITLEQAKALLALSSACTGKGALNSVSIFANSPCFETAASMAAPYVRSGVLQIAVHLNLVEGPPCSDPKDGPLLVDERGMFAHDFGGLLNASLAFRASRSELKDQAVHEFRAQISRYLRAFPEQRAAVRLDSHQHIHMIPLLFDALLEAAHAEGCTIASVRFPAEPLAPHGKHWRTVKNLAPANLAKVAILDRLARRNRKKLPSGCEPALFCGVALSGRMDRFDEELLAEFEDYAQNLSRDLEVLFHPVSVPREQCLDPQNVPFANACASPARDAEAQVVRRLKLKRP